MTDDDRVAVKTYVPRYQKEHWREHADELEMSQSEFVRTMVQAGRREFEVPSAGESTRTESAPEPDGDDEFDDRILAVLDRRGALGWDDLVDALIDDVEDELDATLQRLQDENLVRYSGRDGGYVLTNDE
ncbi:DUF5805 domain-containing protein [Halosolutus gelatinilyticus]|uniref:DUF5805 domain-containing protein n=1 Tax=Halosolutus gelatinilyticus TaxID=2931975 RepID=UPI001FF42A56|nr:DUF5805 domain-containing protein [Halosolutus gelatinilyticus]